MHERFRRFASRAATLAGTSWAFLAAVVLVAGWALSGPVFGFSEAWQLVINTGTTIATFLMVFLIQNAQNRDSQALHLKLDELLRATAAARTGLVNLQDLSDDDLARLQAEFERLRHRAGDPLAEHADDLAEAVEEVEQARARGRHNGR